MLPSAHRPTNSPWWGTFASMQISLTTKAVLGAAVALVVVTGCSDDSKAKVASAIVCERADDLPDAVEEIAGEVADNDLEDAKEEIADLRSDFNSLSSRVESLSGSDSESIQALIPAAEAAIAALESATDIAGIGAALEAGRADIEALATTVDSTLVCDD